MKKSKALFLDRDGVINHNFGYVYKTNDFKFIDGIFDLLEPNKLAMVEDKPWTLRRKHLWHNSGVVGFIDKPIILSLWCGAVRKDHSNGVGDQEILDKLLNPITKITYIKDLPNEYNVMRLQTEADGYKGKVRIMHWTGKKGKDKIRSML